MTLTKQIDKLWNEFQLAINAAAEASTEQGAALHDYTESSWHNDLGDLVTREQQNERQHRRSNSPAGWKAPISAYYAAKVLLMNNAARGTKKKEMPPATIFLRLRQTAAEGITLGYLLRDYLTTEWVAEVETLDYAKIMQKGW